MKTPLRVLCIEDVTADAELLEAHLDLNDFKVTLKRVETPEDLKQSLKEQIWDIALADYSLPKMNAVKALEIIRESGIDLPVIVVSGTIGEQRALEIMRAGARDFIVKGDFTRLIPALRREINEACNRKARKDAEAALNVSQRNFKRLADAMPQLVWTLNPAGQMTYANKRFFTFTGLNEDAVQKGDWASLFLSQELIGKFRQALSRGEDISLEHRLRCHNGDSIWFLTRATASRDEDGKILEWYATSTDIHDQKMYAAQIQEARRQAEQASEAKSAFLSNMSHEIRTPLGAILGFAELMEDPHQHEEERQECIAAIRRNGQLLNKVINQILDLSKIESSKLEFEKLPFDVNELFEDLKVLVGLTAREKGLDLSFHCEENLPSTLIGDPTRIKQILTNIVGNAVKFTQKGSVRVDCSLHECPSSPTHRLLRVEITDTGIGISKEQSEKLFQPFVQVDNSTTRKFGGTGLGLNLSRKLAQAMGGNVVLERSEPYVGSTFVCTIQVGLDFQELHHSPLES